MKNCLWCGICMEILFYVCIFDKREDKGFIVLAIVILTKNCMIR